MMVANGRSIVKQTEDGANAWWWARNEVQPLQDSINVVQPVLDNWSVVVHTSSFAIFCKSNGDNSEAALLGIKVDIELATSNVEMQLSMLVNMHNAKLKRLAEEQNAVTKAKKAKVTKAKAKGK